MFSKIFLIFLFGFIGCCDAWSSPNTLDDDKAMVKGAQGQQFYEEGDYKKASKLLKDVLDAGYHIFALPYADICKRNLDKGNHSLEEAAEWYVRAAQAGNGDAYSYLDDLCQDLFNKPQEEMISTLVNVWKHQKILATVTEGTELYQVGDYIGAAKLLKSASKDYHPFAQELYADICRRQLDNKPHHLKRAAMWYLLSAYGKNSQSYSYLAALIPDLFAIDDHNLQMNLIVRNWVLEITLSSLKPISPPEINNYLVWKWNREIDVTTAQKIPYFFDKTLNALTTILRHIAHDATSDDTIFSLEQNSAPSAPLLPCVQEFRHLEGHSYVTQAVVPCRFGPLYINYHKSLKGNLSKPEQEPKIPILYKLLLTSVHHVTKNHNASKLSDLSHHDYPWLLAGIEHWKHKFPDQLLSVTGFSEDQLIEKLEKMEDELPQTTLQELLNLIEDGADATSTIWPTSVDHFSERKFQDQIAKKFRANVNKYSTTSLSIGTNLVQETLKHFISQLRQESQERIIDYQDEDDQEILRTPLFMYYTQKLVLNNVGNDLKIASFREGQRYFVYLTHLIVNYVPDTGLISKSLQKFNDYLNKLRKRKFIVEENKSTASSSYEGEAGSSAGYSSKPPKKKFKRATDDTDNDEEEFPIIDESSVDNPWRRLKKTISINSDEELLSSSDNDDELRTQTLEYNRLRKSRKPTDKSSISRPSLKDHKKVKVVPQSKNKKIPVLKDDSEEEDIPSDDNQDYLTRFPEFPQEVIDDGILLKLMANVYLGKIDQKANIFLPYYILEVEEDGSWVQQKKDFFRTPKGEICVFASGGVHNVWEKTVAHTYKAFFGKSVKIIRSSWIKKHLKKDKKLSKDFEEEYEERENELHSELYYDIFLRHYFIPEIEKDSPKNLTVHAFSWWDVCDTCESLLTKHKTDFSKNISISYKVVANRRYHHNYPPNTAIESARVPEKESQAWEHIWGKVSEYAQKTFKSEEEKRTFWTKSKEGLEVCKWLGQAFVENKMTASGSKAKVAKKGDILRFYKDMTEDTTKGLCKLLGYLREANWELSCWYKCIMPGKQLQINWKRHWRQLVIPHFGWQLVFDFDGSAQCEMCGKSDIKHIYKVFHPKFRVSEKFIKLPSKEQDARFESSESALETPFKDLPRSLQIKKKQSLSVGSECYKILSLSHFDLEEWREEHPDGDIDTKQQDQNEVEESYEALFNAEKKLKKKRA